MTRRLQRVFTLLIVMVGGTAGCAPVGLDAVRADIAVGQGHLLTTVPFIAQEAYWCGPAALAMVLRYYGAAGDADQIAQALYLASARGTLNLDLEFYARRQGFQARAFEGSLDRLKAEVRQGRPLVVFQDLGAPLGSVPHFAVLVGYDDRAGVVVLHSGTTPYRVVPAALFERAWAARRHWTLLITPAGHPG